MRPRPWILVLMYTSIAVAAALAVLVVGWLSDFPLDQQPMAIGTMLISVVLPFGLVATKRFIDARFPKSNEHGSTRRKQAAPRLDVLEVEPMHPTTAAAAALGLPLRDTRTFEFNREKILYFGVIAMSLCCVGNCVVGLFDPGIREALGDPGKPASLWLWVPLTNLAIVAAIWCIPLGMVGVIAPGYYLKLSADRLVLGRWRRHVDIPWSTVRRLRIEHEWLIATVDHPAEVPSPAHAINGMQALDLRRKLGPHDIALARMRALNGSRSTVERFILLLGWFWGRSKTDGAASQPQPAPPDGRDATRDSADF